MNSDSIVDSVPEKGTTGPSTMNKTVNSLGLPISNPDKAKDIELLTRKLTPELCLDLSLSFRKIKDFLRINRVKLLKNFVEMNGKEFESLKSLRNNNETYVESEVDAQKIIEMKKELADDLDSIVSAPARQL